MFNLEQAIADWRRQMQAAGLKTPVPLEELESHLREAVNEKLRSGLEVSAAFAAATRQLGKPGVIRGEFTKAGALKEWRLVKVMGMAGCGFAGVFLLGLGINVLMIDELSLAQRSWGLAAAAMSVLCLISGRFSHKYLPVIRNRRVRLAVSGTCAVAGLAWIVGFGRLLSSFIVPYLFGGGAAAEKIQGTLIGLKVTPPPGIEPVFQMVLSLLWAFMVMAVLGSLAYGLEEAARRKNHNHQLNNW